MLSPMVMEGSSDEYRSWNTICMWRRAARSSERDMSVMHAVPKLLAQAGLTGDDISI